MTENLLINNHFLTNASVADAKHDFGNYNDIIRYLSQKTSAFASGLPGKNSNYKIMDEESTLNSVVKTPSISPSTSSAIYSPLSYFENTNENNKKSDFLNHNIVTINDKRFNVFGNTALKLDNINNDDNDGKYMDAKSFIDIFNIKHKSAFVIDATAISILTILKKGKKVISDNGEWFVIYLIDDLETRNDPAGKSHWSSIYEIETGVNIIFLKPYDPRVISYVYDNNQINPLHEFFSEYIFKLQTDINGEGCTLIIADKAGGNVQIDNPKEQNAIEYVSSQMMEFLNSINKRTDAIFQTNVKYQQKRSGDWLQVLLCLLLLSRTYKNSVNNQLFNRSNISNVYFLTHDRIALAYALFSGVDTLFTHGKSGTIILFDLQKEPESLLKSEYSDCEIIIKPYVGVNVETLEESRNSYKNAYDKKRNLLKNDILQNNFINEMKNLTEVNLKDFGNKIMNFFTTVFTYYSFCKELTPPENFSPVTNDSLTAFTSRIELFKQDESMTIESKLLEMQNIKMELTNLVNNMKNIQEFSVVDKIEKWQLEGNYFSNLVKKLDFTGSGPLNYVSSRALNSSVVKNTEMFVFLQCFPSLDNEIQTSLHELFFNFSFKLPTLPFKINETNNVLVGRTKEKSLIILMTFCQEVMATFHSSSANLTVGGEKRKREVEDEPNDKKSRDEIDFSTEQIMNIFKLTSLYNLHYVIQEQNEKIIEKKNKFAFRGGTQKRTLDDYQNEPPYKRHNTGVFSFVTQEPKEKPKEGIVSHLNTERRKKILSFYLENSNDFHDLELLPMYMIGISMLHQLENENVYESLDYDIYKTLYEMLLKCKTQTNKDIRGSHLANLFFGLPSNPLQKESLAIELGYQLGHYFDININKFNDASHRSKIIQNIQKIEKTDSSDHLFDVADYEKFYNKLCASLIETGDSILKKIENIEQKNETMQNNDRTMESIQPNIFVNDRRQSVGVYGGKSNHKKTNKKSKKTKTRKNEKKKNNNSIKHRQKN